MKYTDIAYIAGIVDGEGSFSISHVTTNNGISVNWFKYSLRITMVSREVIEKCHTCVTLSTVSMLKRKSSKGKTIWQWQICGKQLAGFCKLIAPYLVEKRTQAETILELSSTMNRYGDGRKVSDEIIEYRISLKNKLQSLTL